MLTVNNKGEVVTDRYIFMIYACNRLWDAPLLSNLDIHKLDATCVQKNDPVGEAGPVTTCGDTANVK